VRLLLIEDDEEAAHFVLKGLRESGYTVDHAADGRDGLFRATETDYDVIITDRMLPHLDGLAIVQLLRQQGRTTPVLVLSALGTVDDRVKGLRAGGDDYLTKPFHFDELVARLRALVRRAGVGPAATVPGLRLDPLRHTIATAEAEVSLTPTEFRVLATLAASPEAIVRRRELVRAAWPEGAIVHDNTLDQYIARLRRKLREASSEREIVTAHGVGYRLA
jgi:DNA-binding response OmpR family regulator